MQSMGFEPMRVSTLELESNALDHSATIAGTMLIFVNLSIISILIFNNDS